MGRFKFWMVIGGVALLVYGVKEWRLSGEVKGQPQTITCEVLSRDGYGDNAHLQVTDFLALQSSYVYQEKRGGGWKEVWIPLVPLNGAYADTLRALPEGAEIPPPTSFGVILQTSMASNAEALDAIVGQDTLQGVVINEIDSLDKETKKLLRESYPGIDVDKCWIVEHDRTAKGVALSLVFILLGVGLAAGGVYLFARRR